MIMINNDNNNKKEAQAVPFWQLGIDHDFFT